MKSKQENSILAKRQSHTLDYLNEMSYSYNSPINLIDK